MSKVPVQVLLDADTVTAVDKIAAASFDGSRSQALRQIITRALTTRVLDDRLTLPAHGLAHLPKPHDIDGSRCKRCGLRAIQCRTVACLA